MKFVGIVPNSFVDYENMIATTLFVGGCNFDCYYCHNLWMTKTQGTKTEEEVLAQIKKNKLIDGVVISGGEPLLQPDILDFIKKIKKMGLKVKVDTNGTNFDALVKIFDHVDKIAMDVKAPFEKYHLVTSISSTQLENVKKSIDFLKTSDKTEFRTTFLGILEEDDIRQIMKEVSPCQNYFLQKFNKTEETQKEHSREFLKHASENLGVKIRNL